MSDKLDVYSRVPVRAFLRSSDVGYHRCPFPTGRQKPSISSRPWSAPRRFRTRSATSARYPRFSVAALPAKRVIPLRASPFRRRGPRSRRDASRPRCGGLPARKGNTMWKILNARQVGKQPAADRVYVACLKSLHFWNCSTGTHPRGSQTSTSVCRSAACASAMGARRRGVDSSRGYLHQKAGGRVLPRSHCLTKRIGQGAEKAVTGRFLAAAQRRFEKFV